MSYTDKEIRLATEIAYMKISKREIDQYYRDNGKYPTLKEVLSMPAAKDTENDKSELSVENKYMAVYDEKAEEGSTPKPTAITKSRCPPHLSGGFQLIFSAGVPFSHRKR